MTTRKTSVEIDITLLTKVQDALETSTIRDTIEEAFLEVLRARARREEVEFLASKKGTDLSDPDVMSGAWRR